MLRISNESSLQFYSRFFLLFLFFLLVATQNVTVVHELCYDSTWFWCLCMSMCLSFILIHYLHFCLNISNALHFTATVLAVCICFVTIKIIRLKMLTYSFVVRVACLARSISMTNESSFGIMFQRYSIATITSHFNLHATKYYYECVHFHPFTLCVIFPFFFLYSVCRVLCDFFFFCPLCCHFYYPIR